MKNLTSLFMVFLIYPLSVHANNFETELFDELPITQSEAQAVTSLFWNAQSIQDKVKTRLPSSVKSRFSKADGCDVKSVHKTEGSADTCDLNDDPEKMAKFIYNFNIQCQSRTFQVSVCSREESKLLNQLQVTNPEKLVSDDNPFDLDSTM